MAPVLRVALSHSGVCRTIPHAIVYAPLKYHGLAVPDLYVEQGFSKLIRLLKFGQVSNAITSKLIRHSGEAMKMELGLNGYLFQQDFKKYNGSVAPSWIRETRRFLAEQDICVSDDLPDFGYVRQHDRLLMVSFAALNFSASDLAKINVCRQHLQALTLADITDGTGERITLNAWNGKRSLQHTLRYTWGFQPNPPATFWTTWRRAIASFCGQDRRLLQPLGHWLTDKGNQWIWWYDESSETLYKRTAIASFCYPEKSARNTRQAEWRFNAQRQIPCDIPQSATPCTVVQQGMFLLFQGTAPTCASPTATQEASSFPSFQEYVSTLSLQSWVFGNIQVKGD
jgi:hypothetical protein